MHDVLARQIHAHRSDEEIALLEVRRLIRSQTAIKAEAREFFTEKQLNFMEPVLPKLQLTPEEQDWMARSRAQVQAQKEAEEKRRREELETARKNAEQESCLRAEADVARREAEQNAAQAAENAKRAVANTHRAKRRTHVAWLISILALALMGLAFWQYRVAEKQKITLSDTNRQLDEQTAEAIAAGDEARRNERFALQRDSIAQLRTLEALSSDSIAKERAADAVTALSSLKITAAQAVGLLLEAADRNILQLEYDAALKKCQGALNLGERKEDTYRRLREIAFFFTESGRYGGADSTLQLILGRPTNLERSTLLSALQKLAPPHFDSLQNRYYPEMADVPGGTFLMGCDTTKFNCSDDAELPPHLVRLDTYRIARTETTVWQYYLYVQAEKRKMPVTPTWQWWGNNPIVNVSWYDVLGYANWLSERQGFDQAYLDSIPDDPNDLHGGEIQVDWSANGYRLPTEAEWEYAARGGPDWEDGLLYAGGNNLDSVAWWGGNAGSRTHEVKTRKANLLGLYDMSGNVWEWCWDWYRSDYYQDKQFAEKEVFHPKGPDSSKIGGRVLRGGSWDLNASGCRSSDRSWDSPYDDNYGWGFRLARD